MVDAGDLVFVGREAMGSDEAKLRGSIKGYYVNGVNRGESKKHAISSLLPLLRKRGK